MRTVGEIMSADLIHVEPSDTVATAASIMAAAGVGSALVMEDERLLGIFTERDVLTALKRDARRVLDSPIGEWMTPNLKTVERDTAVVDALQMMLRGGFRHLPVLEDGSVVGIVSLRDLARALVEG